MIVPAVLVWPWSHTQSSAAAEPALPPVDELGPHGRHLLSATVPGGIGKPSTSAATLALELAMLLDAGLKGGCSKALVRLREDSLAA